jgi:Na+/melibiose symporter-like transporter
MATANLAYFVNVYYIYEGDMLRGVGLGAWDGSLRFFFAIAAAATISKFTQKIDKHVIMMASVSILIIAFVGIYFTTIPGRPWLSLTMKPLLAIGDCGFWVLILSMRADVCDWDEYNTGSRSEGLIAAITNWCTKIAMTLAILISGFALQYVIQFDSKLPEARKVAIASQAESEYNQLSDSDKYLIEGEEPISLGMYTDNLERQAVMQQQAPGTMERMRMLYTLPQVFALLFCLLLLWRYPLNSGQDDGNSRRTRTPPWCGFLVGEAGHQFTAFLYSITSCGRFSASSLSCSSSWRYISRRFF